jgi:hypothetical protein
VDKARLAHASELRPVGTCEVCDVPATERTLIIGLKKNDRTQKRAGVPYGGSGPSYNLCLGAPVSRGDASE